MKKKTRFIAVVLATSYELLATSLLFASPALAACCKCRSADAPGDAICLTDPATGCPELVTKFVSTNTQLSNVTCDPTPLDAATACQPISSGKPSAICASGPTPAAGYAAKSAAAPSQTPVTSIPIQLNVPIPGLRFAKGITEQDGYLVIPYLAQYVSAGFRYLLGIVVITGAVMVVYGGFKYVLSSTAKGVKDGKDVIKDAVIGMIIAFGIVTILQTLNPATSQLGALKIKVIEPEEVSLINKYGSASAGGSDPIGLGGKGSFEGLLSTCKETVAEGPWTRAMKSCAGSSGTKADLIRVIKAFKKEGVDTLTNAAYINGGVNGGRKLQTSGTRSVFMYGQIKSHPDYYTDAVQQACAGKDLEKTELGPNDSCYQALLRSWAQKEIAPVVCKDLIGTDCGYFVSQALACAKVKNFDNIYNSAYLLRDDVAGRQAVVDKAFGDDITVDGKMTVWMADEDIDITGDSSLQAYKSVSPVYFPINTGKYKKGTPFIPRRVCAKYKCVPKKVYEGDHVSGPGLIAAADSGKMRFGAIIMLLGTGRAHFLMYVGKSGDPEIDYDVIETGNGTPRPWRKGGSGLSVSKTLKEWVGDDTTSAHWYVNTL